MKRPTQCVSFVYWLLPLQCPLVRFSCTEARKAVKTVAFITNTTSNFWTIARKGCEKADAELADVKVAFKTTNTGTAIQGLVLYLLAKTYCLALTGAAQHTTWTATVATNRLP